MTGREAAEIRDVLRGYIDNQSEFYRNACKVAEIYSSVKEKSDKAAEPGHESKHGLLAVIMGAKKPSEKLEECLEDSVQFNGRPHGIYDDDIVDVIYAKRELDGAVVVDINGAITHAGIGVPQDIPSYKRKYGIRGNIGEFMGFDTKKEPPVGLRNRSALFASDEFGNQELLITLGETGEMNVYYNGDRIYNSIGRQLNWDMASSKPAHEPISYGKVIPLHPAEEHREKSRANNALNLSLGYAGI